MPRARASITGAASFTGTSEHSFSLWLVPDGPARGDLTRTIASLAKRLGTPVFEPHVTLVPGIQGDVERILQATARLAAQTAPVDVRLGSLGWKDEYFRCLFVEVRKDPELMALERNARELLGLPPEPANFPHLSLLYADLDSDSKPGIAASVPPRLQGFSTGDRGGDPGPSAERVGGQHACQQRGQGREVPRFRPDSPQGGGPLKAGDLFLQADLGRTLQAIARGGAEAFYRGEIARGIASSYQANGGLITLDDLAGVAPEEARPIRTDYRGYEVVQNAPNSQGIAMLIALEILEGYDLKSLGQNSADYVHLVTEALKLAFADRNQYIGHPRFVKDMPVEDLLTPEYAAARRGLIRMDQSIEGEPPPGDPRRRAAILAGREIRYRSGNILH